MTFERRPGQEVIWFAGSTGDGICTTADGARRARLDGRVRSGGRPHPADHGTQAITTPGGADVCAVMNGCL